MKNKKIKPFSFAVFLNQAKFGADEIIVEGNVCLTISTPDYNLGIAIYNGLLNIKAYQYKSYSFVRTNILLKKDLNIFEERVPLKTLSPIVIKDRNNKFLDKESLEYQIELNYICDVLLKSYSGYATYLVFYLNYEECKVYN